MLTQLSRVACFAALFTAVLVVAHKAHAAEVATLEPSNWEQYVPQGKEVDCIYGDHVLQSDKLVAIVAKATDTRHANLTVKQVGGSLIDFTRRDQPSDQLSCYYPHGGSYVLEGPVAWPAAFPSSQDSAQLAFKANAQPDRLASAPMPTIVFGYELSDGADYLTIYSLLSNDTPEAMELSLADGIRADGEFKFGTAAAQNFWWCYDSFWRQAYGVSVVGEWELNEGSAKRRRPRQILFQRRDSSDTDNSTRLEPGESIQLERRFFAARDTFRLLADMSKSANVATTNLSLKVADADGPVSDATIKAVADDLVVASGKTNQQGVVEIAMLPGEYRWVVESHGRKHDQLTSNLQANSPVALQVELPQLGSVQGSITDESTEGVPCRVAFFGKDGEDPSFGPDSAIHGVRNLWHTHNGKFDVPLLPGEYELLISRGPEFDAISKSIEVIAGETTRVTAQLQRTVDTTGWISAELHSHSSPSGDNTSSQRGRVLNLLADHLEFIPCTEHQRISTYEPHLKAFDATHRVLTCTGMELTGKPLPLNHQNVFPLVEKPRTQDGGGPVIHPDPEVQIERIAMWDGGSDKVVQINHPNIAQMVGDRDLDKTPDRGFAKMLHYADVIEVHPPELIFAELEVGEGGWEGRGNVILNWMQLLNLGYRVPGVVNTDAHWNYCGSGWLRNYVRSSTDNPAEANLAEICHALEHGHVVMTNGPFMEVEASSGMNSAGPGDDLVASGAPVQLAVRVQCPNWLDVNRVQVFVNGRADQRYNFVRSSDPDLFESGTVKFESKFPLQLQEDAHVIVAATAEGRQLGRIYGDEQGKKPPIAVSNPIFIDLDANGFKPNGDTLGIPLPTETNHIPTHGHDHH